MSSVTRSWVSVRAVTVSPLLLLLLFNAASTFKAQLVPFYYSYSCPGLEDIILSTLKPFYLADTRLAASLLRLHFHDCFVNGCDGSLLLVDTPTFSGEQSAIPNLNSVRGFNVIDAIKSAVESQCPGTVSCADILAIVARDGVVLTGGPSWDPLLGRRDSLTASQNDANNDIPPPFGNVTALSASFASVGLTTWDLVTLSGAHTIGKARCVSFDVPGNSRLYNWSQNSDRNSGSGLPDPHIDPAFLASLQALCPQGGDGTVTTFLDYQTGATFDNNYFINLQQLKGLLNSDEALFYQDSSLQEMVNAFAADQSSFFQSFPVAMINMGNIAPLQYPNGEIRTNCAFPN